MVCETILREQKKYAADFTPEYALLPKAGYEDIKRISRNQRILFLMRDPVARAKSAIRYVVQAYALFRGHDWDVSPDRIWSIAQEDRITGQSRYDETIEMLHASFRSDQIMFLFYENVMKASAPALKSIYDFLDIEHIPLAEEGAARRVNASRDIEFPEGIDDWLREQLDATYSYIRDNFAAVPEEWWLS